MEFFFTTLWDSLRMIFAADAGVLSAVATSLRVTLCATVLCTAFGVPLAYLIWVRRFPGREALLTVANALLGVPTVAVGLFVYMAICRRGPLGGLDLLFSSPAMVLGQTVLGLPIVVSLGVAALEGIDPRARATALTLGAGRWRTALTLLREGRFAVAAATIVAFGRLIGEVGISMMLGGNIAGRTRNISTAIALETSKGEFAFGCALGIILVSVALGVNIGLRMLQGRTREKAA
jgi:tungstate transport system permease protein